MIVMHYMNSLAHKHWNAILYINSRAQLLLLSTARLEPNVAVEAFGVLQLSSSPLCSFVKQVEIYAIS